MTGLAARGLLVDLQILDNEASAEYKEAITFKWNTNSNLSHWTCIAKTGLNALFARSRKRTICTFKDHFLAILAGVNSSFPPYLWYLLLPQAELTLNLLRQATLNPRISAWEFFQGPFDFNKIPLGPVGCCVLIHAKPASWQSWDFRAKPGFFYIGPALDSYHCFKLVKSDTKNQVISDTLTFCHLFLSVPVPSAKDKIIHGLQVVAGVIRGTPPPTSVSQIKAITSLQEIFESWCPLAPPSLLPTHRPAPSPPRLNLRNSPRVVATSPPSISPMWSPSTAVRPPLQPAAISLTPLVSAPTFHVAPCRLVFGDDHSLRVVSASHQPLLLPSAQVLPVWVPIAHRTRSQTTAALALIASGEQFHEWVQYCIPMAKSLRASSVTMGFAGLCSIHHMTTD